MDDNTIEMFLNEIENVCRKYRLTIAHQDTQGAFVIELFDKDDISWLRAASRKATRQEEE